MDMITDQSVFNRLTSQVKFTAVWAVVMVSRIYLPDLWFMVVYEM